MWEELALAFRLPRYVIEKSGDGSSNITKLYNIIQAWVNGNLHYAPPPTLSSIRQALESPNLGLGKLSNHILQNFTLQDVATEIADFIARKKEITRSTAHIMIVGFPGNGKSHLLDNLLKNPRRTHYSSTGVSDSVVVVDVEAEDSTSHTSAFGIDSTWKRIETRNSFMMQLQSCKTLMDSGKSEEESMTSNFPSEISETHVTGNVMSTLQDNQVESFGQLKRTVSLYFRDTGGQVEFQEILTILIYGPSIFFFVMKTHVLLDHPLTLEYRKGDEVINKYESSTTTRQALVQTLASIDATMKPTGITTHDPLVFIIGTHTDKLGAELKDKEERLKAKEEHLLAIDKEWKRSSQHMDFSILLNTKIGSLKEYSSLLTTCLLRMQISKLFVRQLTPKLFRVDVFRLNTL